MPVLKEREYRLDGLFSPPPQRPDLPAVVLEAQMAADPGFLLRLYAETGRFRQQQAWSGDWRVVVICPHRGLHFAALTPGQEFVERRVLWIESGAVADVVMGDALHVAQTHRQKWLSPVECLALRFLVNAEHNERCRAD